MLCALPKFNNSMAYEGMKLDLCLLVCPQAHQQHSVHADGSVVEYV